MKSRIVVTISILVTAVCISMGHQQDGTKDIIGGATLFKRPQNPPTRRVKRKTASRQAAVREEKSASSKNDEVNDKVEDALALGNSARDREPPDLPSAERAYRLAWKLNPNDPRPYVGLGNVYMDQERYDEAAKAYKEAIRLTVAQSQGWEGLRGADMGRDSLRSAAEWRSYSAMARIRGGDLMYGELELRDAILNGPKNARWHALLAYDLYLQKRFAASATAYGEATRLDPTYKKLLADATIKAKGSTVQDLKLTKNLEGMTLEVRADVGGVRKGHCRLMTRNRMACSWLTRSAPRDYKSWKVQDGLFQIKATGSVCIGEPRQEHIYLKCRSREMEMAEVWVRR